MLSDMDYVECYTLKAKRHGLFVYYFTANCYIHSTLSDMDCFVVTSNDGLTV
jgi:hypothetical protein